MTRPHIALIGMMGTGKSTVGGVLARRLHLPFWDIDAVVVERESRSIGEIFEEAGEAYFREQESAILREALDCSSSLVVALGGGSLLRPTNREMVASRAFVVWLDASSSTLVARLEGDVTRPLLKNASLPGRIETLLTEREEHYRRLANVVVPTDACVVEEVVESILAVLARSEGYVLQ
ncbi:MAG: shikimate kinase [Acidimicrobiales bacterium]